MTAAGNAFLQLNDADLRFGAIEESEGNSTELLMPRSPILVHSDREVRQKHSISTMNNLPPENTAATLSGSIRGCFRKLKVAWKQHITRQCSDECL